MAISGTEIGISRAPSFDRRRVAAIGAGGLSTPPAVADFEFGTSVRPAVMEHMNELLGS